MCAMLREKLKSENCQIQAIQHTLEAVCEDISRATVSRNGCGQSTVVVFASAWGTDTSNASSATSATTAATKTRSATDTGFLLESTATRRSHVSVCGSRSGRGGTVYTPIIEGDRSWVTNSVSNCNGFFALCTNQYIDEFHTVSSVTYRGQNRVVKHCRSPCSGGPQVAAAQSRRSHSVAGIACTRPW